VGGAVGGEGAGADVAVVTSCSKLAEDEASAFFRSKAAASALLKRYSVYLFYWYKSTDTARSSGARRPPQRCSSGTQFTCFTGTKVQMLRVLQKQGCRLSFAQEVLSLLALLVQKYRY
jgi:hypothetical protein